MRHAFTIALLATSMFSLPTAARAQAMTAEEAAQLRAELAALKAQVQVLETRLDAATAQQPAPAPVPTPAPPSVTAKPATEISWKGAPEIKTADGWSFKPRGRMQFDVASIDAPAGVMGTHGGLTTEIRRVFLGVDGKIPGGFSYRVEADFAGGSAELTDVYLTYGQGPLSVTVGHIRHFTSLEDVTSDLFTSFTERAAFVPAFGFERRVGLGVQYKGKQILAQAGVFGDNANDLLNDANNSISADGRLVWMPKFGKTQLHLGGSAHIRDFNDQSPTARYRARPYVHTTDVRLIDTGNIDATGERGYGLEAAVVSGPFHASGEGFWQTMKRPGVTDPTFFGGYAEVGMVLTPGDSRSYRDGAFDRLKPSKSITDGGIGAIEINARYDHLDLNDAGIVGGQQRAALIGIVWAPIDYIRITANYGKLWIDDARIPTAAGDRSYTADTFGLRTQMDF
ncbi:MULTISPECIES: OprO/OprP family phosphate-selective porin [unclassified Sphingopyxis]|uniref:OprO/OprP family phosphate-selective porin n=1 Tax=unclassified Sphingopyxis TaxID=2614943 RepID=UPI0006BF337A|nr:MULTISPECIES: porin [unclassified Sphingopyxis]USI78491.1 porin [Sphingopyxis sp. USTB-05]GAO79100.1 phosphate-specific outer membrane porin OprP [Sphingopyxis sp. C-1]